MTNRASRERCGLRRVVASRARLVVAFLYATAILGAICALTSNAVARSIINERASTDNSTFESFSTETAASSGSDGSNDSSTITRGQFDGAVYVQAKLPAPNGTAKVVEESNYRIPYVFPKGANVQGTDAIELLCSNDQGKTWRSYAVARATDPRATQSGAAFLFQAPRPGEYWFVLKTYFNNGTFTYSSTRAFDFQFQDMPDAPATLAFSSPDTPADRSQPLNSSLALNDDFTLEPSDDVVAKSPENNDSLMIDNAAFVGQEANDASLASPEQPADNAPFALNDDSDELALEAPEAEHEKTVAPWPGKLKTISFGKEDGTQKLMALVRWFTANDLDPQYRVTIKSLSVETAPTKDGPWLIVGQDLSAEQSGYGWIATPEQMQPFYVRTVAIDSNGNVRRDVSPSPLDVSAKEVRDALGAVVTPAPFPENKTKKEETEEQNKSAGGVALIHNTGSEDEQTANAKEREDKLVPAVDSRREITRANTPIIRRERPNIPAPTNPNEFQINPIFTRGVDVVYRATQARADVEPSTGKRSIFTPPNRARRVSTIRPAERRMTSEQALAQQQRKLQEQMQYNQEHEMERYEQKPELMEGGTFYMDSNGNLSLTPPEEMRQAINGINSLPANVDWSQIQQQPQPGFSGDGTDQGVYMPSNTELYDSSARSGAAIMSNNPYPSATQTSSSPINKRYSNGADAQGYGAPNGNNVDPNGATYRAIPQTSYSPNPYYVAPNSAPMPIPPRPTLSN